MKLHLPSVGRLILILLTIGSATMAQQRKIDSLKTVLVHRLPDTTRANTYYDIANLFYKQNQSSNEHADIQAACALGS